MSFTATVENDTIKLPSDVHLPDGTLVTIEAVGQPPSTDGETATLYDSLREFVGCIDTGLGDLAENHDHYLYGVAKRKE